MATDKLRVKIEGDSKSYTKAIDKARGSTKRFQKSTVAANRTTKKQGQTFTQLSYALDDAQYGFRGVQNNLQQIAVQAGIGGPIVLGITAMLIGIQQLITHWDEFGDVASKALSAINKEIAGSQGTVASTLLYAEVLKNTVEGTDEYRFALNKLEKLGFDPLNGKIKEFIELQKQKAIATAFDKIASEKIAGFLGKIVEAQEKVNKAQEQYNKNAGAGQAVIGASPLNPGQFGTRDAAFVGLQSAKQNLASIEGDMQKFITKIAGSIEKYFPKGMLEKIINPKGTGGTSEAIADLTKGIDQQITELGGKLFGKDAIFADYEIDLFDADKVNFFDGDVETATLEEINAFFRKVGEKIIIEKKKLTEDVNDVGDALKATIANAFTGLGQAIGDILSNEGNFGDKFIGLIGAFMQTFGAAIIGIGVAALKLEESLASGQAWLAIGAGIALVAAGAVLANVGKKGVDGQGGTTTRSATTSATTTPSSTQGDGSGQAGWRLDGQDLVFALEAARSDRAAFS